MRSVATAQPAVAGELEQYRRELTGYCYRMLGSAFEAEDAVQETMLRAWRSIDRFEGRAALKSMSFDHVLSVITSGSMADMTKGRTADERKAIASFGSGKDASEQPSTAAREATAECANRQVRYVGSLEGPRWNGWGADINNSRFQPLEMARLTPDQVPKLRLKWAFGFPGVSSAIAQPSVIGGVLFIGGADSRLHALDAKTGCTLWTFATEAPVRTAITFGLLSDNEFAVYFGDPKFSVAKAAMLLPK